MIDNPILMPLQPRQRSRRLLILLLVVVALIFFSARTAISYYVDGLWFASLGYRAVFLKTLGLEWTVFAVFSVATFIALYGWFRIVMRLCRSELSSAGTFVMGTRTMRLPVESVLRGAGLAGAALLALATGASMMEEWPKFALYWSQDTTAGIADPIFGRPLNFYLFSLPVWQSVIRLAVDAGHPDRGHHRTLRSHLRRSRS